MKKFDQIEDDGGSQVFEQMRQLQLRISDRLSTISSVLLIGSGKGGVGKSTLTAGLALTLRKEGFRVGVLDADFNGPTIARILGIKQAMFVPGNQGLILPQTVDGLSVFSIGSMLKDGEALAFPAYASGNTFVWRGTKEFSTLAQILAGTAWGKMDFLLVDLPPGPERTLAFAEFFGVTARLVLVTMPSDLSREVVERSISAVSAFTAPLGYIENMAGYFCPECKLIKPLFPTTGDVCLSLPLLGKVPFDPQVAAWCDRGLSVKTLSATPTFHILQDVSAQIIDCLGVPAIPSVSQSLPVEAQA